MRGNARPSNPVATTLPVLLVATLELGLMNAPK
jgi:hypothetical protein